MYEDSLMASGLYDDQAKIYEILLKNGPLPAGKIANISQITRSLVYRVLEELEAKGLVTKEEQPKKVAIFTPAHPLALQALAEKMERKAKNAQIALETAMPGLASDFNLWQNKPDVTFYEGKEGVKKVAMDSLTSTGDIYSYTDNEAINKYLPELNKDYLAKRKKLGINKKMITIDSPYIRERADKYQAPFSEVRLIDGVKYPFTTVMQIYNNKISYITLNDKKMLGIIIEDEHIATMHKNLFEFAWANAKPLE